MNVKESDVLRDHGERLARIEEAVNNHLPTTIARIEKFLSERLDRVDKRMWWLMGMLVALAVANVVLDVVFK